MVVYVLTEDEALLCDDGWGVPNVFLGQASCAMHHKRSAGKAESSFPASYDMPRRSESGLSGGWGTTLLCVPAQRPDVPGYVPTWLAWTSGLARKTGRLGPITGRCLHRLLRDADRGELEDAPGGHGDRGPSWGARATDGARAWLAWHCLACWLET